MTAVPSDGVPSEGGASHGAAAPKAAHSSFSEKLPLARHEVDRDYLARERDDLFPELLADPNTRILPVWKGRVLFADDQALALLPPKDVPAQAELVYLGRSITDSGDEPAGTKFLAALLTDDEADRLASSDQWGNLRMFATELDARDAGLATEAIAIANWHASHRFSPRSGRPLRSVKGGWVREEADDGHEIFPRTDPAIIVGVTDADDRLLLGSNALWEKNRFSLLAGFVEPGESLEQAVEREIFEESGVRVIDPVYLGSQPWPFPASLMLGFRATVDPVDPGRLEPDGAEIIDLRWFTRDELASAGDTVILPGRSSIARAIIEDWYGSEIDD